MHFSFVNSLLVFSLCFVFLIFKIRSFQNSVVLFGIVLICCARIKYKPVCLLPSSCYKIERIVKANQQKIVFIGKGKEKVLFTLKIKGTQEKVYYPNDIVEYKASLKPLPLPKTLDGFKFLNAEETKQSMENGNLSGFLDGMGTPKGNVDTSFLPL